ncbi:MAG: ImmA/IrrE family metallo-endopeptidase [Gemmatimonadaceae bacterium]
MLQHILVNAAKPRRRQRYSVAHEIGHTLFPDYEEELRRVGRLYRRNGDDTELERLCQAAAAEILMPLDSFVKSTKALSGRTIGGVFALSDLFDVSTEAVTRRVVETSDEPMVAVLVRPRDASTGEWIEVRRGDGHAPFAALGVASVFGVAHVRSDPLNLRGAAPPKGSAAERAWKRVALAHGAVRIEVRDAESWQHVGIAGSWHCEAVALPKASRAPREVLCLMRQPNRAH